MKIFEIRVLVEPDIFNLEFYKTTVRIFPAYNPSYQYGVQRIYPIDHLKSLFDLIWEDIGKEMKEALMKEENDEN